MFGFNFCSAWKLFILPILLEYYKLLKHLGCKEHLAEMLCFAPDVWNLFYYSLQFALTVIFFHSDCYLSVQGLYAGIYMTPVAEQ